MSSQEAKYIRLRLLHNVLPATGSEVTDSIPSFPGPLFADPGSINTGIINTGVSASIKTKKVLVLKYLSERLDEMERGVAHLPQGSIGRHRAESKVKLVQLLRVLVEGDGSFSGSTKTEQAVRDVLSPLTSNTSFSSNAPSFNNEQPLSNSAVKVSALMKLEEFLLAGDRRQAYQYAIREGLWGHAMVIARSLESEAWIEVIQAFINSELDSANLFSGHSTKDGNRLEGLRIAYALLGGFGPSSVPHLLPNGHDKRPLPNGVSHPISPNLMRPPLPPVLNLETSSQWPKMANIAFSNPVSGHSATLTALGDQLVVNQWIEAAHCCYLLSPQTSSLGGACQPSTKVVLLGSRDPVTFPSFSKDSDPFIFTEIVEFALSLSPLQKAPEAYSGLQHLQPYRLVRAYQLAELGYTATSTKYCEAIGTSLRLHNKASPCHTQCFLERLKELSDRLSGVPVQEKAKSWVMGKVAKPSLDSLGGWLEGRITKFIAGDGEPSSIPEHNDDPYQNTPYTGAFAGYSAISSAHTSQCPSPSPSIHYPQSSIQAQPIRPESASRVQSNPGRVPPAIGTDRIDSPVARVSSAQSYPIHNPLRTVEKSDHGTPASDTRKSASTSNWWDRDEAVAQTPVATTFYKIDQTTNDDGPSGHPMADSLTTGLPSSRYEPENEEGEDLGFGNPKSKSAPAKVAENSDTVHSASARAESDRTDTRHSTSPTPADNTAKSAASSSWLGWLWKRDPQASGPIRAKLGEEKSSFYYDKELKRWVNGKESAEPSRPSMPPPPPSRLATAPPGTAPPFKSEFGKLDPPKTGGNLVRPASAAPPPRAKSVVGFDGSNPIPPPRSSADTPPSRPSTRASTKRNIRSRYVDVFQQEAQSKT